MNRPVCRCLPSFTCTCAHCYECWEMLTPLEEEQGWQDARSSSSFSDSYTRMLCNPCRLEKAGLVFEPAGGT